MDINKNKGTGRVSPEDAEEYIAVEITVEGDIIKSAVYDCSGSAEIEDCAQTVCKVINGKSVYDIMQMNANAVMYNTETDIPRMKLYCCFMAVTAAKKAANDYFNKNGIKTTAADESCSCFD